MDKKGFLFTVTIFLILTYILLSISVWVKGAETSELAYSEFYKESTVQLTLGQITPAKIDNITNIIMNHALFRLNENVVEGDHAVNAGPPGDQNANISDALYSLMLNGTAPATDFADGTNMSDDGSSLTDWVNTLNQSLLAVGVYVSGFNVTDFSVSQGSINTVNYSFNLSLDLNDYTNTSSVTRTYTIDNSLDITGLVDPALATANRPPGTAPIYRQFFFNTANYSSPGNISIPQLNLVPAQAGQGWLYGYLASASPSDDPLIPNATDVNYTQRGNYILVGNFQDIISLGPATYNAFAGYIVTDSSSSGGPCNDETNTFNPIMYQYSGSGCTQPSINLAPSAGAVTSNPFIVVPGFNASTAPECPIFTSNTLTNSNDNGTIGRCALITNEYSGLQVNADPLDKFIISNSSIYGVESMRDFVMCGYYTKDSAAPSYFQRLLPDPYSYSDPSLGIETFVIGEYANTTYDTDSRLDWQMFGPSPPSPIQGTKIMGMPGCKDNETCSDTPSTGIFAADHYVIAAYNLGNITLGCSGAGCG